MAEQYADTIKNTWTRKGCRGRATTSTGTPSPGSYLFQYTFGRGLTPFTVPPWTFLITTGGPSPIYNLPRTPGHEGEYGDDDQLDYHPVQPFLAAPPQGHPDPPGVAGCVRVDTHTDPVRRGRGSAKAAGRRGTRRAHHRRAKIPDDAPGPCAKSCIRSPRRRRVRSATAWMNPLGYPLEQFDDFGRFRTAELLEHPDNLLKAATTRPTCTRRSRSIRGATSDGTGDTRLDGPVTDAFDLIVPPGPLGTGAAVDHPARLPLLYGPQSTAVRLPDAHRRRPGVCEERRQLQSGGGFTADVRLLYLPQETWEPTMTTRRDFMRTAALGATGLASRPRRLVEANGPTATDAVHLPAPWERPLPERACAALAQQGRRRQGSEERSPQPRPRQARTA